MCQAYSFKHGKEGIFYRPGLVWGEILTLSSETERPLHLCTVSVSQTYAVERNV